MAEIKSEFRDGWYKVTKDGNCLGAKLFEAGHTKQEVSLGKIAYYSFQTVLELGYQLEMIVVLTPEEYFDDIAEAEKRGAKVQELETETLKDEIKSPYIVKFSGGIELLDDDGVSRIVVRSPSEFIHSDRSWSDVMGYVERDKGEH